MIALLVFSSGAETLRIATFNVKWLTATASETHMAPWNSAEQLAAHRRGVARVLAESVRADVVCILEATSRAALDALVAEPVLQKHGYRVLHLESGDTGTGQDVAFLVLPRVRLDTLQGRVIRRFADTLAGRPRGIDRGDPRRQRLTKHAIVCLSAPGPRICLMGLHLLAHPGDKNRTARRETQARIAAGLIRTEITARGYAPVVLGDLNDFDPDIAGAAVHGDSKRKVLAMLKDFDPLRPGPELFNAASRVLPKSERYSAYWDKNRNGTREASEPVSMLDHILLDSSLSKRLKSTEILHDAHDGSVSDHWPVVVELR